MSGGKMVEEGERPHETLHCRLLRTPKQIRCQSVAGR
jgi:hypothetical protein